MRRWLAIAGTLIGVLLIGYAVFSTESEEEKIATLLTRLAEAVSVDGQQKNLLMRAARINGEFKEIFEEDVRLSVPELASLNSGRSRIAKLATQAGARYRTLHVDFSDLEIEIDGTNHGARVETLATLTALGSSRPRRDERQVSFELSKPDGDWLISSVKVSKDEQ